MRTARSLPKGVSLTETPRTETPLDRDTLDRDPHWPETPWTETNPREQNHRCKNITFPQLRLLKKALQLKANRPPVNRCMDYMSRKRVPKWTGLNTVHEEHAILLYRRDRTMVAFGKKYFQA